MKTYVVVLAVVVGILGGFYGGYKVGHSNVSASTASAASRTGGANGGAFGGGRGGGSAVAGVCPTPGATPSPGAQALARGTITDLNASSLTITSTACDVKVTFGPTVSIQKQASGTTADLQDNLTVTIIGTRRADGSILAQTIQIGTAAGGFNRGGVGTGTGTGTGG
jgi:hypothetical protein